MELNKLTIQKSTRVYQLGNSEKAAYKWLCLHGYGQLGQYFLQPFEILNADDHFIIAPEGFHRFYLNGTNGRVGASWMTKEDRLTDIEDNINYLNQVEQEYLSQVKGKLVCFAFSQGAATLIRWLEMTKITPEIILIWAGSFPEDVEYPVLKEKLKNTKIIYAVGNEDEYATLENRKKQSQFFDNLSSNITQINFTGKHKIYPETLIDIIKNHIF